MWRPVLDTGPVGLSIGSSEKVTPLSGTLVLTPVEPVTGATSPVLLEADASPGRGVLGLGGLGLLRRTLAGLLSMLLFTSMPGGRAADILTLQVRRVS